MKLARFSCHTICEVLRGIAGRNYRWTVQKKMVRRRIFVRICHSTTRRPADDTAAAAAAAVLTRWAMAAKWRVNESNCLLIGCRRRSVSCRGSVPGRAHTAVRGRIRNAFSWRAAADLADFASHHQDAFRS